jgi:hypothetical protein
VDKDERQEAAMEDIGRDWGVSALAMERFFGALAVARLQGWTFDEKPESDALALMAGKHVCHDQGYEDVILIDFTTTPIEATGARYAIGESITAGAVPLRGPMTGPPDEVLAGILGWEDPT